jgi:hypothetical protein
VNGVISVQFEWVYTPEDYFEKPLTMLIEGGQITIDRGIVLARVEPEISEENETLSEDLDDQVERKFQQIKNRTHKSYELGMPFKFVIKEDGSRIVSTT